MRLLYHRPYKGYPGQHENGHLVPGQEDLLVHTDNTDFAEKYRFDRKRYVLYNTQKQVLPNKNIYCFWG